MAVGGILERDTVHVAVRQLVSRARAGQGGALFVVGETGLGKTTIFDHAKRLVCPDVRIGWGRGDVTEKSLPLRLFADVLDTVGAPRNLLDLSRMDLRTDSGVQAARSNAVLRWLETIAPKPVLLAFDDIHWADRESAAVISFLARRLKRLPVAIFATLRPWPPAANELAAALAYDGYAGVERLAPLSQNAAAKLLTNRLGGPVSSVALHRALDLCGGNPLLLEQMAASILQGEDVGAPTYAAKVFSRTKIVSTRFAGVPKVAIHCARAASVLGTRFRPELAAAMAQLNDQEADTALDALCRSGLIHSETGKTAKFVHPLFRQALYNELAAPVRTRLHARAFTALTAQGLYAEAVDHAAHADLTGDECAIEAMTRAGMAALRSNTPALATRHLQAAVHAAGSHAGSDLLLALAESLLVVDCPCEAILICERLRSEELTRAQRLKMLRMLGRAYSATGRHNDSGTFFAQAVELVETHGQTETAEVLLDTALASLVWAGPTESLPLAERAYTLAANATKELSSRVASVRAYVTLLSGNSQGLAEIEASAKTIEKDTLTRLGDLNLSWDRLSIFAIAATFAERFDDAQRAINMLISATGRIDTAEAISGLATTQAIVAARQGQLAEALSSIERASSSTDPVPTCAPYIGSIRADILHQMGRSAEAMECCDRIELEAAAHGESCTLIRLWNIRGQHLLRDGRLQAASELYVRLEDLSRRMGIGEPCWIPWARHAIAAHLSAYRTQDARRVISWLDRSAAQLQCRYPRVAAAMGRAGLAEAEGNYEAAETHFSSALAYHDHARIPLEQAETLLAYGAFLRRRGNLGSARSLLAQAGVIAETNQAGWLLGLIREESVAAGGRRRRNHEEATKLTIQEQRVARLAAAGHSNKSIAGKLTLSIKTIEYHLQRIYAKLGINSRRQLMTENYYMERPPLVSHKI